MLYAILMTSNEQARYLIENNQHMTIATSDREGNPWVSPVFFAPDDDFNLYWVSSKQAQHSRNLRFRPQVSIVIFGTVPPDNRLDGVYIQAEASELHQRHDIATAMAVLALRPQPEKFTISRDSDVMGINTWRIYQAVPLEVTKRADAVDDWTKQAITVREPVNLTES